MLSFSSPWWLLCLPLPVLLWRGISHLARTNKEKPPAILHPQADLLQSLGAQHNNRVPWQWLTSCLLLLVALSQPQWLDSANPANYDGHNMILAIDVSGSMRAMDYLDGQHVVSRLDIVKQTVSDFLDQRHGDRIGLIVFGDDAYLYAPLTTDISLLKSLVADLETGLAGEKTALGDAIALAADKLRVEDARSRILLLLTDGSNTSGVILPENATRLARHHDIRIYTIGVGREGKVLFPQGPASKPQYTELPMDRDLLQDIARETGGRFFLAGDQAQLQNSIDAINREQRIELKADEMIRKRDLYAWPLALAVLMLLLVEFSRRRVVVP